MKPLIIVKIGGDLVDNPSELNQFIEWFSAISSPKILVHGGGKIASQLATDLGIETQMHEGRRITSSENLRVVCMAYAGEINSKLTALLQASYCNAIGLSGCDGNAILAKKRSGNIIDYGFVGDIIQVNGNLFHSFLQSELVPVVCPITHDGNGQLLNTNADTIATHIAIELSNLFQVELKFQLGLGGVIQDAKILPELNANEIEKLIDQKVIYGGMLPKISNAQFAVKNQVHSVEILNCMSKQSGTSIIA